MPLIHSPTKEAWSKNYGKERAAGKSPAQAAAIAYRVQREARKGSKRKTRKSLRTDYR